VSEQGRDNSRDGCSKDNLQVGGHPGFDRIEMDVTQQRELRGMQFHRQKSL
jgi:hypothetical protein